MKPLKQIPWNDQQGNRYSKALDSLMLTAKGLPFIVKTRATGKSKNGSQAMAVVYDKAYVINWLIVKVINPLGEQGYETVSNLLREAWEKSDYYNHRQEQLEVNAENN